MLGLAACASSQAPQSIDLLTASTPASEIPLEPGDGLRVVFSAEPTLDGDYIIDERGQVALPLLGIRDAVSLPANEIRDQIAVELQRRVANQSVQVSYLRRVRVLGEVREPGLYFLDPTMSYADAVALAGGATPDGDINKVSIRRSDVELVSGVSPSLTVADAVRSGDAIFIPKTPWLSRNGVLLLGAVITTAGIVLAAAL